jgi:hypothetical protein
MELRPELQLKAAIKALKDTIIPAVDSRHGVAVEQANLVVHSLEMIAENLPKQYRYDRHELDSWISLAAELIAVVEGDELTGRAVAALKPLLQYQRDALAKAGAEPDELHQGILAMRSTISAVVTAILDDGSSEAQIQMQQYLFSSAKQQLLRERSWLAPMGLDPELSSLPPIESLLDDVKT